MYCLSKYINLKHKIKAIIIMKLEEEIRSPLSDNEWTDYYNLRYRMLRQPWNRPLGSEKDEIENECIHAAFFENDKILGVCRLQINDNKEGQIRYMAVENGLQGRGIGKKILAYIEQKAREKALAFIVLHARENAVMFYQSCDYKIITDSYLLYGVIPHIEMRKELF